MSLIILQEIATLCLVLSVSWYVELYPHITKSWKENEATGIFTVAFLIFLTPAEPTS